MAPRRSLPTPTCKIAAQYMEVLSWADGASPNNDEPARQHRPYRRLSDRMTAVEIAAGERYRPGGRRRRARGTRHIKQFLLGASSIRRRKGWSRRALTLRERHLRDAVGIFELDDLQYGDDQRREEWWTSTDDPTTGSARTPRRIGRAEQIRFEVAVVNRQGCSAQSRRSTQVRPGVPETRGRNPRRLLCCGRVVPYYGVRALPVEVLRRALPQVQVTV